MITYLARVGIWSFGADGGGRRWRGRQNMGPVFPWQWHFYHSDIFVTTELWTLHGINHLTVTYIPHPISHVKSALWHLYHCDIYATLWHLCNTVTFISPRHCDLTMGHCSGSRRNNVPIGPECICVTNMSQGIIFHCPWTIENDMPRHVSGHSKRRSCDLALSFTMYHGPSASAIWGHLTFWLSS